MSDRDRPRDWPLSGPIDETDTVDEITGRFTALADHPQLQGAFLRIARRLDEIEKRAAEQRSDDLTSIRDEFNNLDQKWRVREEALSKEMRDRDHSVRNDSAKATSHVADAVTDVRKDLIDHEIADTELHADLVGKPGGGDGRIGEIVRALSLWRKIGLGLAAGIAGSVLTIGAWLVKFGDDRASMRERLGSVEREVDEMKGANRELWRRLLNLPAHPAPPGDVP